MGQNSICHKTMTKLTKTQNVKKEKIQMWPSSKTKNKTTQKTKNMKLKMWQNSKLKMWQSSKTDKTQNMTTVHKSKYDKTQKLKWCKNWKTQNVRKKSKCDETQQLKMWQNSTKKGDKTKKGLKTKILTTNWLKKKIAKLLVLTTWHLDYPWDVFEAAFCNLAMFLINGCTRGILTIRSLATKRCL